MNKLAKLGQKLINWLKRDKKIQILIISQFLLFSGNVFVIAAILLERNLQNVANYLIVSLAVADLMVACLVMPLGAVYEVSLKLYIFNHMGRCIANGVTIDLLTKIIRSCPAVYSHI